MSVGLKTSTSIHDVKSISFQKRLTEDTYSCVADLNILDVDGNRYEFTLFGDDEIELDMLPTLAWRP